MRRPPVSSDKRLKPVSEPAAPDHGPRERWQHGVVQMQRMDALGTVAARVVTECALDVLQQAGQVTAKMWQAGLQLRRDYVGARVEPRAAMRYAPTVRQGRGTGDMFVRSEREELAYRRWRQALQVVGVGLSEALVSVCCLDRPPTQAQQRQLVDGLEALARHYRM